MRIKRLISGILGVFCLLPGIGLAARASVEYSVAAGYDDVVRNGALFPVVVIISNRVMGAAGDLQLINYNPGCEPELTFHLPIQTPLNSVKRYECLMRAESGRIPRLIIQFDKDIDPVKVDLNLRMTDAPIILAVDAPRSGLVDFAPKHFVIAGPGVLRADPLAYDGLYALAVSGRVLVGAIPEELDALKAWVCTGGRLIVVEPLQEKPFLKRLEALTQAPEFVKARTGLCRVGSGWVGFMSASNRGAVAEALRFFDPGTGEKAGAFNRSYTSLWKRDGSFGIWGVFGMALIMLAYLLAIGPGDYFLCKRWRKSDRTWLVFGSMILVFAMLAWNFSRLAQGGRMRLVQLTVLDVAPGLARAQSMVWLYSTHNTRYFIECMPTNIHMSAVESIVSAGSLAHVDVFNGSRSHMLARIPVFSDKHFDLAGYLPWSEEIDFKGGTNEFSVGISASLSVEEAYVVGPMGLASLTHHGGRWIQNSPSIPLADALKNMHAIVKGNMNMHNYYKNDNPEMPASPILSSYLKTICLTTMSYYNGKDSATCPYFSTREQSFSIEDRACKNAVLLLLLKPDSNRMPMTIRGYDPDRMECTLVRVPIPAGIDLKPEHLPLANPKSTGENK